MPLVSDLSLIDALRNGVEDLEDVVIQIKHSPGDGDALNSSCRRVSFSDSPERRSRAPISIQTETTGCETLLESCEEAHLSKWLAPTATPSHKSLLNPSPTGLWHFTQSQTSVEVEEGGACVNSAILQETQRWCRGPYQTGIAQRLLHLLVKSVKGHCFLVHSPSENLGNLKFEVDDKGYLQERVQREEILHSVKDKDKFGRLLSEFSDPLDGGIWPRNHPDESARGKPKSGGFAISAHGNLRLAGVRFCVDASIARFSWPGASAGCNAALAVATILDRGVVFVSAGDKFLYIITSTGARQGSVCAVPLGCTSLPSPISTPHAFGRASTAPELTFNEDEDQEPPEQPRRLSLSLHCTGSTGLHTDLSCLAGRRTELDGDGASTTCCEDVSSVGQFSPPDRSESMHCQSNAAVGRLPSELPGQQRTERPGGPSDTNLPSASVAPSCLKGSSKALTQKQTPTTGLGPAFVNEVSLFFYFNALDLDFPLLLPHLSAELGQPLGLSLQRLQVSPELLSFSLSSEQEPVPEFSLEVCPLEVHQALRLRIRTASATGPSSETLRKGVEIIQDGLKKCLSEQPFAVKVPCPICCSGDCSARYRNGVSMHLLDLSEVLSSKCLACGRSQTPITAECLPACLQAWRDSALGVHSPASCLNAAPLALHYLWASPLFFRPCFEIHYTDDWASILQAKSRESRLKDWGSICAIGQDRRFEIRWFGEHLALNPVPEPSDFPLLFRTTANYYLASLNVQSEMQRLQEIEGLSPLVELATAHTLQKVLIDRPCVLHLSAHVVEHADQQRLLVEMEFGEAQALGLDNLVEIGPWPVQLLVFLACGSETLVRSLMSYPGCEMRQAVCCKGQVHDESARVFCGTFYHALTAGWSAPKSYEQAQNAVRNSANPGLRSEADKFVFLSSDGATHLLPQISTHKTDLLEWPSWPRVEHHCTERLLDISQVAVCFTQLNKRAVCILGEKGVGKSALCKEFRAYFCVPGRLFSTRSFYLNVQQVEFTPMDTSERQELADWAVLYVLAELSKQPKVCILAQSEAWRQLKSISEGLDSLGNWLVVVDGISEIGGEACKALLVVLDRLLDSTSRMHLLLTACESVPAAKDMQTSKVLEYQLKPLSLHCAAVLFLRRIRRQLFPRDFGTEDTGDEPLGTTQAKAQLTNSTFLKALKGNPRRIIEAARCVDNDAKSLLHHCGGESSEIVTV